MTLNEIAKVVHQANIKWWQNPVNQRPINRNKAELLMLVVTELSEAVEGERKNLMDDKLPHRKMAEVEMADAYIRILDFSAGFGYELIDDPYGEGCGPILSENKAQAIFEITQVIASLDNEALNNKSVASKLLSLAIFLIKQYCKQYEYDIYGAYDEKMAFNAKRVDHTHEARLIAGGKQF